VESASRLPKKLAIAGAIILGLSIAVLVSFADDLEATTDPSLNSVLALEGGESGQINLSKDSSYLLFRLTNGAHNCTITEEATQTDVTIGEPGWFESDRPGEGGELYYVVGSFIPDENGLHSIENSALEGETLWVVDIFDVESNIVWITYASCCGIFCGSGLIPLAFILWRNGRKNVGKADLVMQTADGMLVPIAPADGGMQQRVPTTDEIWRSVHGNEVLNLSISEPLEEQVPAPFADRPDRNGEHSRVIDEIESVEETVPETTGDEVVESQKGWKSWDEG
jgi:hypothetical protein